VHPLVHMPVVEQAAPTAQAATVLNLNLNHLDGRVTNRALDKWVSRVEKTHSNHAHQLHRGGVFKGLLMGFFALAHTQCLRLAQMACMAIDHQILDTCTKLTTRK